MPAPKRSRARDIAWAPQAGPQKALVDCPIPEVLFGGARGGGKTDGVLGKWAIKSSVYPINAVFFRRELPMLDDAIERSQEIYGRIGGTWLDHKKTWRLPGGGRIRFRPLENTADADKYQGQNLTDACVEEAGLYPTSRPIDRLFATLRSASGVPTQLILTANPGGAGQLWIKQRYIDPAPLGMKVLVRELPNGSSHRFVFIPSKIQDNKILLHNDASYINNLYLVGSAELVKAWLDGDWSAVEGAFFDCWSQSMIIEPFRVPDHWTRIVSMDWGSAKPFSVGWWAIVTDDYTTAEGTVLPRGAMVRYREWYGCRKERLGQSVPNVGLKLTAEQVGAGIIERSPDRAAIKDWVIDPSAFAEAGGPSIVERLGLPFRRADNRRVAQFGALGGWDVLRQRMQSGMLYTFSTCVDSIRTIPVLQHDETRAEDLDTESEDHCFVAGTPVLTEAGEVEIDTYDYGLHGGVWSAGAWRYAYGRMTRSDAETLRLVFEDGSDIECTPDHRYLDRAGDWRCARDLLNVEVSCDLQSLARRSKSSAASGSTVKPVRCVSVERRPRRPVYCLTVPDTGAFTVHGLIVRNCADEWRYAVMARPFVTEAPPPPRPLLDRPTLDEQIKRHARRVGVQRGERRRIA